MLDFVWNTLFFQPLFIRYEFCNQWKDAKEAIFIKQVVFLSCLIRSQSCFLILSFYVVMDGRRLRLMLRCHPHHSILSFLKGLGVRAARRNTKWQVQPLHSESCNCMPGGFYHRFRVSDSKSWPRSRRWGGRSKLKGLEFAHSAESTCKSSTLEGFWATFLLKCQVRPKRGTSRRSQARDRATNQRLKRSWRAVKLGICFVGPSCHTDAALCNIWATCESRCSNWCHRLENPSYTSKQSTFRPSLSWSFQAPPSFYSQVYTRSR